MIRVEGLVYDYPTKRALFGVDFEVSDGAVAALVGPNGAGKTTLLRCLAALDEPYDGRVLIDGLDTRDHPRKVRQKLAYLPDFFGLYDALTIKQCLTFAARSHGVSTAATPDAVLEAATRVGLEGRLNDTASSLSRGMRQRLAIAQTLVYKPRLLLLDEPAAGLDPDARRSLSALFLDLQKAGMTLVVSSHILSELEDYCTAMLIIDNGRVRGDGLIQVNSVTEQRVRMVLLGAGPNLLNIVGSMGGRITQMAPAPDVGNPGAQSMFVHLPTGPHVRVELLGRLVADGCKIADFALAPSTLEEAYRVTPATPIASNAGSVA